MGSVSKNPLLQGKDSRHTSFTSLLKWLWPRMRPFRWVALGTIFALAVQGWMEAYPLKLLWHAINNITDPKSSISDLLKIVALFYGCSVVAAFMSLIASFLAARWGTGLGADLRQNLHDHIHRLSSDFFEDRQSGDLLNRSMGDVTEVQHFVTAPLTWVGDALFNFGFAFFLLLSINWQLTLMCTPIGFLLVGAMYIIARRIRPIFRRYREVSSDIFSMFSENVSGMREIQAFTRESAQSARYKLTNQELRGLEIKTAVTGQLLTTAFMLVFPLATVVVLWQGGVWVKSGILSLAALTTFLVYARMLIQPLRGMGGHYSNMQKALVSAERIMEVLETAPRVQEAPNAIDLPAGKGAIAFENVCFSYNDRQQAIGGVSFRAEPGQMIALVGPSGAGKTTLVKLLMRYYDPQGGRITLDGYDLKDISFKSMRGQMGVVFQDPFLFNGTLRDNIAFGRPGATPEEICAAARAADLEEFINDLDEGYETRVGERGVKLSGGQRSRLAIARAMLRNPRILILDEATSQVDTATERRIQTALDRLVVGRTCVVIAHRLSTVVKADKILVLSQGRLIEEGTHQELLIKAGAYAELYHAQFAAQSVELDK